MTQVLAVSAKRPGKPYTPEERAEILAARERGESYRTIGDRLGRTQGSIWNVVNAAQALVPRARVPDADAAQMREEYEGPGKPSLDAMAARWGWSRHAIHNAIHRAGGVLRSQGRRRAAPPDDEIARLRARGLVAREIAAEWGCSEGAIWAAETRERRRELGKS